MGTILTGNALKVLSSCPFNSSSPLAFLYNATGKDDKNSIPSNLVDFISALTENIHQIPFLCLKDIL